MGNRFGNSVTSLEDRIRALRAEIDTFIDTKVAEELRANPGASADVLRNILTNRAGDCQCRAYLRLQEQSRAPPRVVVRKAR